MVDENVKDSTEPNVVMTVSASSANGMGSGVLVTPAGFPNGFVKVIDPLLIILVRAARTFLQTLLATLAVGAAAPATMGATDFYHAVIHGASISVAAGFISLLQNLVELMAKFDQSHPTLTS